MDTSAELIDLSPPPSSMSSVSTPSIHLATIENAHDQGIDPDSIDPDTDVPEGTNIVGKPSPLRVLSDPEDEADVLIYEQDAISSLTHLKRKRSVVVLDEDDDKDTPPDLKFYTDTSALATDYQPYSGGPIAKGLKRNGAAGFKGALLGHWRDSPITEPARKHAVVGFIDVKDRLRTRIHPVDRQGNQVPHDHPIPPGPGGSWVRFERIVFCDHLIGLDQFQIKEYIRLRTDLGHGAAENGAAAELQAVRDAIRRVHENPPPENVSASAPKAWGAELPEGVRLSSKAELKRRRTSGGFNAINSHIAPAPSPLASVHMTNSPSILNESSPRDIGGFAGTLDPLSGTRPTRILLGCWKESEMTDRADRQAVFGILSQNDMFRVKLVRTTRDGRHVDGFPPGPGALWIHYDQVDFDPHLRKLERNEIKEYCRVRQRQIDHGETEADRISNETKAVYEAQARVSRLNKLGPTPVTMSTASTPRDQSSAYLPSNHHTLTSEIPSPPRRSQDLGLVLPHPTSRDGSAVPESRHNGRASRFAEARPDGRPARHALPEAPMPYASRMENKSPIDLDGRPSTAAIERTQNLARREISRMESAQTRADQRLAMRQASIAAVSAAAAAAPAHSALSVTSASASASANGANGGFGPSIHGKMRFHETDEVQRLNKVWARQEASRLKADGDDAKIYGGVKYERKTTGPFEGKLVSQGTIINIDDEDYVEYRVLTKPSFF